MSTALDDSGRPVPVQGFDFDLIDRNLFNAKDVKELKTLTAEEMDRTIQALATLLRWIFQDGMKNSDGLKIRSIICCWIFLRELRSLTLQEMASGFGMDKQSLGRWHDVFKLDFPHIKTSHMRDPK